MYMPQVLLGRGPDALWLLAIALVGLVWGQAAGATLHTPEQRSELQRRLYVLLAVMGTSGALSIVFAGVWVTVSPLGTWDSSTAEHL
jgi:hypothetical protein